MDPAGQARVERRLAAILAADVAGYSRLIGTDEGGTLERLKALRRELLDPKIAEHRGRLVKTSGDGLLVEFGSVVDALRCAVDVQREMTARNAGVPPDSRIEFRIGINVGDIVVEDGDIFGDGVNVAARLEALAEPGGTCVSARVQEDAAGKLDLVFEDIGEQQLKNIARPVRAYRVGMATRPTMPQASSGPPLPDKPSIAVLPFANMSGDPEQEYFADGMVEEITTALSKVRWFFVVARNSTFTYKDRTVDVKQVGHELGVRYVLEGSVRKSARHVRITAQLIEAATGNHIWAERYDREIADIFAVQDEITECVVAAIEPQLYAAEHFRIQRKPPESLDAWECVIRAMSLTSQATLAGFAAAEELCRRAIALAPDYGRAHSLLAWVLIRRGTGARDMMAALTEAIGEAQIAISLDEQDPWAHLACGFVRFRGRRYPESERALRQAVTLNPNLGLAHAALGPVLALQGEPDAAIAHVDHALKLSPGDRFLGFFATHCMTMSQFIAARYPDAAIWARKTIELRPEFPDGYRWLIATAAISEDLIEAAEALAIHCRLVPDYTIARAKETLPFAGEAAERFLAALRKAGMPEE